jgi:hypothetical protein
MRFQKNKSKGRPFDKLKVDTEQNIEKFKRILTPKRGVFILETNKELEINALKRRVKELEEKLKENEEKM